jgi:hypothetical protein
MNVLEGGPAATSGPAQLALTNHDKGGSECHGWSECTAALQRVSTRALARLSNELAHPRIDAGATLSMERGLETGAVRYARSGRGHHPVGAGALTQFMQFHEPRPEAHP